MKTLVLVYAVIILVVLAAVTGWVKNIIKLTDCDFASPYKCEVVHAVGVIPVVGAVTGWLDVGK